MRLSLLLVILGMLIEISVIVNSFALKQDWQGWIGKLSYTEAHRLYILNSIGGFLGSLLLIYGAISFSSKLRVSRGALRWLFLCGVFFVTAKAFDVIDTIWNDYMDALLGAFPYTDQLVMNVLFVSSALALLSGMICALKDLHRSNTILELQNRQLDSEMRAHQKASEQAHAREAELTTILNALKSPVERCFSARRTKRARNAPWRLLTRSKRIHCVSRLTTAFMISISIPFKINPVSVTA